MQKKTIGSFLAVLRKSKGMTQQEVADRLNVSNKTISKWECDESYPEITLIPVLAELFGVTSDEILKGERIKDGLNAQKDSARIIRQIEWLVNNTVTKFKNMAYVAVALVLAGLICLFTLAFSAESIIGLGIFFGFVVASALFEIIQINIHFAAMNNNELIMNEQAGIRRAHKTMTKYAISVFYAQAAAIVLALPIITGGGSGYFFYIPLLVVICMVVFGIAQGVYAKRVCTKDEMDACLSLGKNKRMLNGMHAVLLFAAVITVNVAEKVIYPYTQYLLVVLLCMVLAALAVCIVFAVRCKSKLERRLAISTGIRNMLYGLSILGSMIFYNVWEQAGVIILFAGATLVYYLLRYMLFSRKGYRLGVLWRLE